MLISKTIALREECHFRISDEKVLGKIFKTEREELSREQRNYIKRSLIVNNLHHTNA
jgi:hypothetical protein